METSVPQFSYGVWLTVEGPNEAIVRMTEDGFIKGLQEALAIKKGDVKEAMDLIRAHVMMEFRKVRT